MNVNTQYYDAVVDRAAMLRLFERRLYDQVEVVLDGHVVRLDTLLKKGNLLQRRALLAEVEKELKKTFREAYAVTRKGLLSLAQDQLSYTFQKLEASVGKVFSPERPAKRVADSFVLERPLYMDKTLHAGWAGVSIGERKRIETIIREGIAEGKTRDEIAVKVREGNVHNISRNQSKTLVTTAITSVTTQMDHAVYKHNEDVIEGWQYVAVLDSRTTPLCSHRDGKIYSVDEVEKLPPAHYGCRSTTTPVFKSWETLAKHEGLSRIRKENLAKLSNKDKAYYDGLTPAKESYDQWLRRQPLEIQLKHIGDYKKMELFQSGKLHLDKFTNLEGKSIGINELRAMSDSGYVLPGQTRRFTIAKEKLDSMQLWARSPDDFIQSPELKKTLKDYFILQTGDLDGTLSLINFRGIQLATKQGVKRKVLTTPPTEAQMVFNPIVGSYQDIRMYQPQPAILQNNLRKVLESPVLLKRDKEFIVSFVESLKDQMGMNERAVIADNLRIVFGRARESGQPWSNYKAVTQAQIKFDVTNTSEAIETHLRRDTDFLKKLVEEQFIDPVLGSVQIDKLQREFRKNIKHKKYWEDAIAPKLAEELHAAFNADLLVKHPLIWNRISPPELKKFYNNVSLQLSAGLMPDADEMALSLGRKLYNMANLNGNKDQWLSLGWDVLNGKRAKKFFEVETFGVQKRRMRSKMSGSYFGPYYDTLSYNIRIVDKRMQEYARVSRAVDISMRLPVISEENRLYIRPGYKSYFLKTKLGWEDTRIPIISKTELRTLPDDFVDKTFADSLNWASKTKYRIDEDFYDFIRDLLYFQDDKGKAKWYNERNEFRKYLASRGDTYERFKMMEYLREKGSAFSNHVFIDHRARVYERGFIGPQAGETFNVRCL